MKSLHAYVALVALSSIGAGCKKKPEQSPNILYQVRTKDLAFVGATLTVGGKTATFAKKPWNSTEDIAQAEVSLPRNGPSAIDELALELKSPCGTKTLPLKAKETKAEEDKARASAMSSFSIELAKNEPPPKSVNVWVDASDEKVTLGKLELPKGRTRIYDPKCKDDLAVKVDGDDVGAFGFDESNENGAVFITTKKGICYSLESVGYGAGMHSYRTILRGKQVYEISTDDIEYFLTSAPSSKQSIDFVHELVTVSCDEKD